ncbi:MAG: NAD(P)-binding protein [Planctomycetales bacterium]|nr:NAD(P)-binding protein [Planctomycetales bacterium]NIP69341.1 NAD(P)-binding protein [Planctomycetales bacterium]
MKIAIVGTGISGNLVARLLAGQHDVHLFEAAGHVGGHAHTQEIEAFGRQFTVDTGFMVCNDRTYPNFLRLLDVLQVPTRPSDMSFSVRCDRRGLEYQGSSWNGLFAQRANLLRPSFYQMLRDVWRFNRQAVALIDAADAELALEEFLQMHKFSRSFTQHYLVPMAAAIWSARADRLLEFPATFIIRFFHNHGLLQIRDRPQWRTVVGGAKSYVEKLVAPLADRIRLHCPVATVQRHDQHVVVTTQRGEAEVFDQVVLATHADQALKMLVDADRCERETLQAFPYQENEAVLHTDTSLLPRRRRAWASWNYHVPDDPSRPVAVTYDLSRLQGLDSPSPICVTLNPARPLAPARVLRRMTYHHPLFRRDSLAAQRRHAQISGRRRTHFCGAYWGNGFHEDGVNSALAVGKFFGKGWEACTAVFTKAGSDTVGSSRRITGSATTSS